LTAFLLLSSKHGSKNEWYNKNSNHKALAHFNPGERAIMQHHSPMYTHFSLLPDQV